MKTTTTTTHSKPLDEQAMEVSSLCFAMTSLLWQNTMSYFHTLLVIFCHDELVMAITNCMSPQQSCYEHHNIVMVMANYVQLVMTITNHALPYELVVAIHN